MMLRRVSLVLPFVALTACASKAPDTAPPTAEPVAEAPEQAEPVDPIPDGWHVLTPQIAVKDVDAAIAFYVKGLGAEKLMTMADPAGKTIHGEVRIGDSLVMIDIENEGLKAPETVGGTPATLMLYVADAAELYDAAVAAGATAEMPLDEQFWGDRYGTVVDPFGHRWAVASHVTDLTEEEMQQRTELLMAEFAPPADGKKKKKGKKKKGKKGKPAEPAWKQVAGTPSTQPVPEGYHTLSIALTMRDANAAIEHYKATFGATERTRMPMPDGKLMHAEIQIGDTVLMMHDEIDPSMPSLDTLQGWPIMLHYYVEDVDAVFGKVIADGGQELLPATDMFWGDRYAAAFDAVGVPWGIATHVEDVPAEEMEERMKKQMEQMKQAGAAPAEGGAPADAAAPADAPAPAK